MTDQKTIQTILSATAYDDSGDKVGKVGQLFVGTDTGEPTFVSVNTGLFGHNSSLVPLVGAKVENGDLHLAYPKNKITDAPNIADTDEGLEPAEEEKLYRYYGLQFQDGNQATQSGKGTGAAGAFGAAGTAGAAEEKARREAEAKRGAEAEKAEKAEKAQSAAGAGQRTTATDDTVVRSEEKLNVDKDVVSTGKARLRKYVVKDTETVEVPVTREEVRVEREPISADEAAKLGDSPIGEDEAEVVLHEERVNVQKETVPVEKINLKKEQVTDTQKVSEDLRKEKVEFEDATTGTTEKTGKTGKTDTDKK